MRVTRRIGTKLRLASIRRHITRQGVAHTLVLAGGAGLAVGAALVYLPAGVMLAGGGLIAWAMLIFDVG